MKSRPTLVLSKTCLTLEKSPFQEETREPVDYLMTLEAVVLRLKLPMLTISMLVTCMLSRIREVAVPAGLSLPQLPLRVQSRKRMIDQTPRDSLNSSPSTAHFTAFKTIVTDLVPANAGAAKAAGWNIHGTS